MKFIAAVLAVAVALALQTTLAGVVIRGTAVVDLVLVVLVYVALMAGPVSGLLLGSVAGLIQDASSSGIIGIGGLAKTVVGFVAGVLGAQFIWNAPTSRLVVFVAATFLNAGIFIGLYTLLEVRQFDDPWTAVATQALVNGFVGVLGAHLVERMPGMREKRRNRRMATR